MRPQETKNKHNHEAPFYERCWYREKQQKCSKCSTQWSLSLGLETQEAVGIGADRSELEVMARQGGQPSLGYNAGQV